MICSYGYQIGHDYNNCNCSECDGESHRYCRKYNKTCVGKADFGSKVIADMEARRMGKNYQSYECPFCGGWHVGRKME